MKKHVLRMLLAIALVAGFGAMAHAQPDPHNVPKAENPDNWQRGVNPEKVRERLRQRMAQRQEQRDAIARQVLTQLGFPAETLQNAVIEHLKARDELDLTLQVAQLKATQGLDKRKRAGTGHATRRIQSRDG